MAAVADVIKELKKGWAAVEVNSLGLAAAYEELRRLEDQEQSIIRTRHLERAWQLIHDPAWTPGPAAEREFETTILLIRTAVDAQRNRLRARTMDLSRGGIRALNIFDLPSETLDQIIYTFKREGAVGIPHDHSLFNCDSHERLQTVQSLRLTCRKFYLLASPLLVPILEVRLDQASLARAECLSRNWFIARGIRVVRVALSYRPRRLAEDLMAFRERRMDELEQQENNCHYYAETWSLGDYDYDDDTACPLPYAAYREGMDDYCILREAWDDERIAEAEELGEMAFEVDGEDDEAEERRQRAEYLRILLEGHERFRQKHDEQHRMVWDRSFVDTLAQAMVRMPRATTLAFTDNIQRDQEAFFDQPTTLLTADKTMLHRFIDSPLDWFDIERVEDEMGSGSESELAAVKILTELPIAIHKAGVRLREMHVGCFPLTNYHMKLCPGDDAANPAWDDFRAACQSLEVCVFGTGNMHRRPIRRQHLPPPQAAVVNTYLRALVDNSKLKQLDIWMLNLSLHDGTNELGWCPGGGFLGSTPKPSLKRLSIMNIAVDQKPMEGFCASLGFGIKNLYLCDIAMTGEDCSWARVLDLLCVRVATNGREKAFVLFTCLSGGEFGTGRVEKKEGYWDLQGQSSKFGGGKLPLLIEAEEYVVGRRADNPLRY
ncbi:hypothetical protein B0T19DRAFT_397314 [Cercophora scortea]|uniref:Uncharacterized protein n=1 Tax=Cercophora scortea TaxID=314031 RepID=A0AAE0J682_9PEZI|nr:hypothetical protein B0T19DRAFT_397314 [Cercophora scortea]